MAAAVPKQTPDEIVSAQDHDASLSSNDAALPNLETIYASLDKLYTESDLRTVSAKDIFKALAAEFDVTHFPKKIRKLLKLRLANLVKGKITPKIRPNQHKNVKEEEEETNSDNDMALPETNARHGGHSVTQGAADSSEDEAHGVAKTSTAAEAANENDVTMQYVSRAMMDILQKEPNQSMKKKELQRAIQRKCNLPESKKVKKLMKKLIKHGDQNNFKLDGKIVTMIGEATAKVDGESSWETFRV